MNLFVANWKMNLGGRNSLQLAGELIDSLPEPLPGEVVLCPPATALFMVGEKLKGTPLQLGCQNIYHEEEGAYTGEISPSFVKEAGALYVMVGHSERRHYFQEGGQLLARKIKVALQWGLQPILCVGENLEERETNRAWPRVKEQITEALVGFEEGELKDLVVAYEPVWAIGTGHSAQPADVQEMVYFIREELVNLRGLRILYGGSVKGDNIKDFMELPDIEGVLVGGASLDAREFSRIVNWEKN